LALGLSAGSAVAEPYGYVQPPAPPAGPTGQGLPAYGRPTPPRPPQPFGPGYGAGYNPQPSQFEQNYDPRQPPRGPMPPQPRMPYGGGYPAMPYGGFGTPMMAPYGAARPEPAPMKPSAAPAPSQPAPAPATESQPAEKPASEETASQETASASAKSPAEKTATGTDTESLAEAPIQVADSEMGSILTDASGNALYTYKADPKGRSVCVGGCAKTWPPFTAEEAEVPEEGPLSLVQRRDGSQQWALDGKPLYFYVADRQPGQVKGDGVGNVWSVARPE
jgi:predicted lipoprotein with Yx(FWY)xxD motif